MAPPPPAAESPLSHPGKPGRQELELPFDAQLALQLLREHARRAGAGGRQKNHRTPARAAGNKEIAEALAKRLKGFALRHSSGQALRVEGPQEELISHEARRHEDHEGRWRATPSCSFVPSC